MNYFTDAVLRGPTVGSMLMCLSASLIGVIVFLRRQSLIGEALSHASYPGVILGIILAGSFSVTDQQEAVLSFIIILGAFFTAFLGILCIHYLEKKLHIRPDSALCFVLSSFFGIGLTLASEVQFSFTSLYRQAQTYLYGQAATMTDADILIYGVLSLFIVVAIILLDKELEIITFNREYAVTLGINTFAIDMILFILTALAVVIGIRSVGVVLMSAMLIIPAVSARQFTNHFGSMLVLAALFGMISAYFGNILSVELPLMLSKITQNTRLILPTGPSIVIVASLFCIFSLLFAPERGVLLRFIRIAKFRYHCLQENILKAFWRSGPEKKITFELIKTYQNINFFYLRFIIFRLVQNGWLEKINDKDYRLTQDGIRRASHIVRLHRLWEVYLADYLGVGAERVHKSAEEMEHIITPALEQELTSLLKNPAKDPHQQAIPAKKASHESL